MDIGTTDAEFSNVYHDHEVPEDFIESIEVSVESGYHAGEVSFEESTDVSYKTNFLSEILNVTDSERYLTNFANEIENVDSELYRTSFESDYLYNYPGIGRSDDNSDENYYDDSLEADYYEEMKTMENLIQQNSDLYMTNFNLVVTVSPGYKEFSLDENPSLVPETKFTNSETKTLSDIEESLTTEMTFFEDQTTHGFRVNNSFGLKEEERVPTNAIPTAADTTSGELDLTGFDGINSTFASNETKMDIEMSQRKASIFKSGMTFVIPQNISVQTKSQVSKSVSTSLNTTKTTTANTSTRSTSTTTTSTTTPTSSTTSTTTHTTTTTTSTHLTTTVTSTTSTHLTTTVTSTTTFSSTSTTTIPSSTTITLEITTQSSSTTTTPLIITSTQSSLTGSLKTENGFTDIMPRKMPLVDNKNPDSAQYADTDDNSVLIPLGHGLYTKFVLNKDTKLNFNFLNFI